MSGTRSARRRREILVRVARLNNHVLEMADDDN
jgi:hypothetical protein